MVQIPQGIAGWLVFVTGILIILYRAWGIFDPRAWVELLERQFAYQNELRVVGGVSTIVLLILGYFVGTDAGPFFWISYLLLVLVSAGLTLVPNHLRMLVVATAEGSDRTLKIVSIIVVIIGLLWALAPWFV